jgi:hypothetical protein
MAMHTGPEAAVRGSRLETGTTDLTDPTGPLLLCR